MVNEMPMWPATAPSHTGLAHVLFACILYACGYCTVYAVHKELRRWPFRCFKFSKTALCARNSWSSDYLGPAYISFCLWMYRIFKHDYKISQNHYLNAKAEFVHHSRSLSFHSHLAQRGELSWLNTSLVYMGPLLINKPTSECKQN